jgi:mannose-6-phosphate isomerase-like protein (cupin superfamily)
MSPGSAKLPALRRIVTGHDAEGKAVVTMDGPNPHEIVREGSGIAARLVWVSDRTPANAAADDDRAATIKVGLSPPKGGSVLRVVDFPPVREGAELNANPLSKQIGDDHKPSRARPIRHPLMHRTQTLDYAIVMSGEIDMLLDDTEVHLEAGDVLVQQATNHAWVNRGTETCRIAFVLMDADDPLE